MLETIDKMNWEILSHAYGSAKDIPKQIFSLISPDPKIRKKALWNLYGNIFHQGTRYEASAYAVPFLFELLQDEKTPQREEILFLLVHLAVGYSEFYLPYGFSIKFLRAAAEGDSEESKLALWAVRTYEEVLKRISVFQNLLSSSDQKVRMAALYALAWFQEQAEASTTCIREFLKSEKRETKKEFPKHDEQKREVLNPWEKEQAHALITLGILDGYLYSTQDHILFQSFIDKSSSELTKVAAALALVWTSRQRKEDITGNPSVYVEIQNAISILLQVIENPKLYQYSQEDFLFREGDLVDYVTHVLQVQNIQTKSV